MDGLTIVECIVEVSTPGLAEVSRCTIYGLRRSQS